MPSGSGTGEMSAGHFSQLMPLAAAGSACDTPGTRAAATKAAPTVNGTADRIENPSGRLCGRDQLFANHPVRHVPRATLSPSTESCGPGALAPGPTGYLVPKE
ncbi:hypothetical protein GCM10027269_03720 [Kribbella endophytica]